ncbi:MAG TPA: hypothetical protein VNJ03_07350 [Vicinamibacterales bacterium]|nr:hypothetical protein [Vicinamibacterales bacterium]
MTDFQIRSDNVDVQQIMGQIRARIREKRGVDYTEEEIKELARVKLETFLDPRGVRSDLLDQFRKVQAPLPPPPKFVFEDTTIFETHRGILRWIRKMLRPILTLFFNPNPIAHVLNMQVKLNQRNADFQARRERMDSLQYELVHNLVLETTRLGIEVKNLKMRIESMSGRLDFDERRARALEGVVQYRPGSVLPLQPPASGAGGRGQDRGSDQGGPEARTRRRRRRGRPAGSPPRPESGASGSSGHVPVAPKPVGDSVPVAPKPVGEGG